MKEIREKEEQASFQSVNTLYSFFNKEADSINESIAIMEEVSKKHNVSFSQIVDIVKNKNKYMAIPVGVFRSQLSPLEAVVRYLKDMQELSFVEIARLLFRDETTIWTTYQNSLKRGTLIVDFEMNGIDFKELKVKKDELIVPLSVFAERKLSILESLCLYLKNTFSLNYHNIALIVNRDERTVWTVVSRSKKKLNQDKIISNKNNEN